MLKYVLNPAQKRVEIHVSGKSSGAELMTGLRGVLDDPRFDAEYTILIDVATLQQSPTISELRDVALAVRANSVGSGARRAIVTSSTVFFELARLFARLTAGSASTYRAFRTREEAEAWLVDTGTVEEDESDSLTV